MRKVIRLQKPESLVKNAERWTEELMSEIAVKGSYSKVENKYKNRYRQEDVKNTLEKMYGQHCCYCESIIGVSAYGRIEHLKPKSLPEFYRHTFDWENLHWCCEVCNTGYKKAQWNFRYPILDPTKDEIEQYLRLNLTTGEYEEIDGNKRAITTILHTGMNREELVRARRRIVIRFLKDYKAHLRSGSAKEFCDEWRILKEDMNYPSLYDELIRSVASREEQNNNKGEHYHDITGRTT